ncbi:elongation factor Ts [Candidatus Falkowbacteria bacterium]|nr:elongation factor Ts [Candidatus Falkowbacteria bacterium]
MAISLELIKELREKSGAGMADCKNALTEANGDLEQAMDVLRKKGIAKAAKRSDRETGEGLVKVATNEDNNEGYMFSVCAETDFVVRSEQFQAFAAKLLEVVKAARVDSKEALMDIDLDNAGTVGQAIEALSSVVGEKIELKQYATLTSGGTVAAYSHAGEQIGALVALDRPNAQELARDLAMQVAAANPKCSVPGEVAAEELQREKDIYAEQLKKEGKPEAMIEKIMTGKINKYYEEVCLTEQEFIKDDTKKIKDLLAGAKVEKFVRFAL